MKLPPNAWTGMWATLGFAKPKTCKPKILKPRRLQLEQLETRWLMSTVPTGDAYGGNVIGGPCIPCAVANGAIGIGNAIGDVSNSAASMSTGGVQYGTGVMGLQGNPSVQNAGGITFSQNVVWTNESTTSSAINGGAGLFGFGMSNPELPQIGAVNYATTSAYSPFASGTDTIVVYDASISDNFVATGGGNYTAYGSSQDTLKYDSTNDVYDFTDTAGNTIIFHGFNGSITPTNEKGQMAELIDAGGNTIQVNYDATTHLLQEVDLYAAGSSTAFAKYDYSYYTSGANAGMVSSVGIYGEAGTLVQQIDYTYYNGTGSGIEAYGNLNDLMTTQVEDPSGNVLDTTYYRYYTSGFEGLEYIFANDSYTRLVAQYGSASTAMGESNSNVVPFADDYLQYNFDDQVSQLVAQGQGCSVCSDGLGTYTYSYTNNSSETSTNFNLWANKTTETYSDGGGGTNSSDTIYSNFAGETLLSDHYDLASGLHTDTFYVYDTSGRLEYTFDPSEVASYSTTGSENNLVVDLNTTGLIAENVYYTSSTASDVTIATSGSATAINSSTATAGGVTGLLEAQFLIRGASSGASITGGTLTGSYGTADLQDLFQYYQGTQDLTNSLTTLTVPVTVDLVANTTVYTTANTAISGATGGEEDIYSYTMYAGTAQVDSETLALPSVSDQPSGGSSDTVTTIYDLANRPIWEKDANGTIDYAAYDPATSAVIEQIVDVSSAEATTLGMPGSLSIAGGSHLNLTTTYQVDYLGRVTEVTDPDDDATFIVYDDADHETRTYTGWTWDPGTSTFSQMTDPPPTVVTLDNLIVPAADTASGYSGSYSEVFTMSATPHTTGGVPDGTEAISDVQSLSLAIMNQAGQVIETDAYYNLPSLSGDVASGVVGTDNILNGLYAGTQWTPGTSSSAANYYATTYAYDDYGNLDRMESPDGTIIRTVYDSLGRAASEWVGTDDTTGSYSGFYWSPANSGSIGNMVEITSYQYDDGGVGDSNLTQEIDFESEDGSTTITPRVTQFFYDWQDRLVATKQGVLLTNYHQAAGDEQTYVEDTSGETSSPTTQLPITYDTLDNLGEVTQEAVYNGNGVTISYSSGVPQAPTTGGVATDYAYDAQGREYQSTPYYYSGGTWYSSSLTTSLRYNGDGDVVTSTDPLSNVTSYVYDRAERETSMSLPNASTGAAGGPTTTYGYDADGNLTSVTDAMSNVTTYDFDAAGRETAEYLPVASTGASGGPETSYAFDAAGNLETLTDPDGNVTTYSYDALGRETGTSEEISEDSSTNITATNAFTYDGDDNLIETIDADGRADVYTYNDLGQQTEEQWYSTSSLGTATNTIQTTYDLDGNVLTAVDTYPTALDTQDSSYTFTYNTLGQQITADNNGSGASGTTGTAGVPDVVLDSTYQVNGERISLSATIAGTADFDNTYTYNYLGEAGLFTQQGVSGGDDVGYKQTYPLFDNDGRLTSEYGYGGAASWAGTTFVHDYAYDHDGNMTTLDDWGIGTSYSSTNLEELSMTYNADQQLTAVTSTIYSAESQSYGYDHDGQLTSSGTSYSYDANGNISGTGDTVGDGNAQLAANGYSYTFDAAGNMLSQTNTSTGAVTDYTWDNRNRLTSVTNKNSSGVTLQVVNYTYDSFDQLIGESVTPYSGGVAGTTTTQRFVFDVGTGEMVLAFNGSGNLTDRFFWGPLVDQILADEKVTSLSSYGSEEWLATDNRGDVTDVYTSTSSPITLLDHVAYNSFGGITSQTNPGYAPQFGYNGEYTDPATGLQKHGDRWYDPRSQRWLTQDPIFPLSGSNPYEYCDNSPTNYADPSGNATISISEGVYGAVGPLTGEGTVNENYGFSFAEGFTHNVTFTKAIGGGLGLDAGIGGGLTFTTASHVDQLLGDGFQCGGNAEVAGGNFILNDKYVGLNVSAALSAGLDMHWQGTETTLVVPVDENDRVVGQINGHDVTESEMQDLHSSNSPF